jgi:uncharacterized protein (TIGR01777 family)
MKRILISGGSGFIGRRLIEELLGRGDQVTVLTRDLDQAKRRLPGAARAVLWDPETEGPWFQQIASADAIVHLAGETVATRWSETKKRRIERSRVEATRLIVEAIGRASQRPSVLVCASATGYYGPTPPDKELDETAEPGTGFLADVCKRWEAAARAAEQHGVRTVQVRIGLVLGEGGGALEKMIPPFRLFVGGPLGDGTQVVPWIHRDDMVGILLLALDNPDVKGPINAVSPNPVTSRELAEAIGAVLHRPSWLSVPTFALNLLMGQAAEIVTTGQRVLPRRAVALGYTFKQPKLMPALASILAPT